MSNKDLLDSIKKLREMTGVGFKDCNIALDETKGNIEKSIEYLVNNILSTTNFTKVEFRYSELLTNFIEDISLGIRPRIAINKFVLDSEGI